MSRLPSIYRYSFPFGMIFKQKSPSRQRARKYSQGGTSSHTTTSHFENGVWVGTDVGIRKNGRVKEAVRFLPDGSMETYVNGVVRRYVLDRYGKKKLVFRRRARKAIALSSRS